VLDEVGELPAAVQVKLLRVLQERTVRPVGGEQEIEVDVRVLAATNRDVEQEIAEGRFRQDLFYRLNVIRLHLPPLRERVEDIPLLAQHFLEKHAAVAGKHLTVSKEAMRWIASQPYPGNVRELENVIERAVTLAIGAEIVLADLPLPIARADRTPIGPKHVELPPEGVELDAYLADLEKGVLLRALEEAGGVRTKAAALLGMTFRSFRYRLAKYGIGDSEDGDPE
jgi:two-component system response regulator PilR (NtrC family)